MGRGRKQVETRAVVPRVEGSQNPRMAVDLGKVGESKADHGGLWDA